MACGQPVSAQEGAPGAGSADFPTAEVLTETDAFSVEPIAEESAALPGEASAAIAEASEEELRKVIPEAFLFRVATGGVYDSNIYQAESGVEDDLILQAQLGVTLQSEAGGHSGFLFDYNATGFMFPDHSELDGINHVVGLNGRLSLPQTELRISANYQKIAAGDQALLTRAVPGASNPDPAAATANQRSQEADREAGQFSGRNILALSATASRDLAPKTVVDTALSYAGTSYDDETYQSSGDISGRVGLGYKVTGKSTLGFAGVLGHLDNDDNPSQDYQSGLMTASYDATGKLVFNGDAGLEWRQYDDPDDGLAGNHAGASDSTRFVFALRGAYQWRPRTALHLAASRSTDGSAVLGQSIDRTTLALGMDQQLGQRFALGLSAGYELPEYHSTGEADANGSGSARPAAGRADDSDPNSSGSYWYGRATLNFLPTVRSSIGLFYDYRNEEAGAGGFTYEANRIGVQCAVSF
ncbi:MAG: hypothetical protein V4675_22610 [Verrucomicrobiota bacterium]